jgi:alkylation response protein AidB-like acyl-CoA dehydrogenase
MDFQLSETEKAFQEKAEQFVLSAMPPGYTDRCLYCRGPTGQLEFEERDPAIDRFRERMGKEGWLTMAWPKELGGGGILS